MPRDLFQEYGIVPKQPIQPTASQTEEVQPEGRDLFAEAGISPTAQQPAQQPVQQPVQQQAQPGEYWKEEFTLPVLGRGQWGEYLHEPARLARSMITGFTSGARDIANVPHYLSKELLGSKLAKMFPKVQESPIEQYYAVKDPNYLEQFGHFVGSMLPAGGIGRALEGAKVAGAAIDPAVARRAGMMLYGASQEPKSPLRGAAISGLAQAGLEKAGRAAATGIQRFAASGLAKDIGNSLERLKNWTNGSAFERARGNYSNYSKDEKNAWDRVHQIAMDVDLAKPFQRDQSLPVRPSSTVLPSDLGRQAGYRYNFDNSNYIKSLKNEKEQKEALSKAESAFRRKYQDSVDLLNDYIGDRHDSFSNAIQHMKSLNYDYENEISPGKNPPFQTINFARREMKKAFQDNIDKNNLQNILGKPWNLARQITSRKNEIFNKVISPKGKSVPSIFSNMVKQGSYYSDPTTFVDEYLPKSKGEGTARMEQFASMIGNDRDAENTLKINYFKDSFKNNELDPKRFIKKFNDLSDKQKLFLFNEDDIRKVNALSKIIAKYPKALDAPKYAPVIYHTFAGLLGAGLGRAVTGDMTGALAGAGLAGFAKPTITKIGRKIAESPRVKETILKGLENGESEKTKQLFERQGLERYLASMLPAGAITPRRGQE